MPIADQVTEQMKLAMKAKDERRPRRSVRCVRPFSTR